MKIVERDAFDLPDWLGTEPVSWRCSSPLDSGPYVRGELTAADGRRQELNLIAVDAAFPVPVCPEPQRRAVHRAWQYGEVVLLEVNDCMSAGVPGRRFDANLACETLRRLAKSVAAKDGAFTMSITL